MNRTLLLFLAYGAFFLVALPLDKLGRAFEIDATNGFQSVDLVTFYGTTDQKVRVGWDHNSPKPDYYKVALYSVERSEETIVTPEGGVTDNSFDITLPRTGHYIAKIAACLKPDNEGNAPRCSEWSESSDPEVATVEGEARAWWIYGHVAPTGDITLDPQDH